MRPQDAAGRPYEAHVTATSAPSSATWTDRASLAPDAPSGEELLRLIRRAFGLRRYRPRPLPQAALRLLRMTDADEVDFDEVARIMEHDIALSAEVMRIANSAAYLRGAPIETIGQAVNRLGFAALREIASQAAIRVATPPCESYAVAFELLLDHGAATAHLTRAVARAAGISDDAAYLPGLFHDLGLMAPLMFLADVYGDEAPSLDAVWPEIERIHGPLGWQMCGMWDLPAVVGETVRQHHSRPAVDALTARVVLADHLATAGGASVSLVHPGELPDDLVDAAVIALDMPLGRLDELEREAEQRVAEALGDE